MTLQDIKELIPNILKNIERSNRQKYFSNPAPVLFTMQQLIEAMGEQLNSNNKKIYIGMMQVDNSFLKGFTSIYSLNIRTLYTNLSVSSTIPYHMQHICTLGSNDIIYNKFVVFDEIRGTNDNDIQDDPVNNTTFNLYYINQLFEGLYNDKKIIDGLTFYGYEISI
jgi:hypothetical protein